MTEFYIGQTFSGTYPPEAAIWCNEHGDCFIEEAPCEEGRAFRIVKTPDPTEEEIIARRVIELKQKLADTDYLAIKYAEGRITAEEFEPISLQREMWRKEIRELEND